MRKSGAAASEPMALVLRALISGVLIALASVLAKRQPALGALIASLPLVSVMAMVWLWRDGANDEQVARFVGGTLWYFLPSLPMFVLIPAMLRAGTGFWPALAAGSALTVALYLATSWLLARTGAL